MSPEEYKAAFAVAVLSLALVAAFPTASMIWPFPRSTQRFSELWLLGPNHMAENYPFNVRAGDVQGPVYVGVSNHLGRSGYYLVYVKFRNHTQQLPNATASEPSPLSPLYEFQFFLEDGETWEAPVSFTVEDVSFDGNRSFVTAISIEDHVFPVNLFSSWDSEYRGFFYQLFFELWLYNTDLQVFQVHDRFVGLWIDIMRT
ncbi:MAG: DUF1616 domain-containing protein [Candidatus Bathyarchaeota archaeon]|nr:MAG: DUF1616 domain-containing protein [Candidatus Bathyarchaeota archaeon]